MAGPFKKYSTTQIINDFGQMLSPNIYSAALAASTDTSLTVPTITTTGIGWTKSNRTVLAIVRVKSDAEVYMALNTTATEPAGASFASTDAEMVSVYEPYARVVTEGDVLHFITPDGSTPITVAFYPYQT